jgi:tetratricopeptide (TPR) repeat protein
MIKKLFLLFLLPFIAFLFISCAGSLYNQGRNSLADNQYDMAIKLFTQETQTNPQNNEAWRDLGIAQYKINDFGDAESSLLKAYGMVKDGETIFYLGLVYEALENYDKAINYYKEYSTISVDADIAALIEGRISFINKKKMEQEVKLALQNEEQISKDPVPANTVAILYFQNLGNNKELDPLQKGLAEMLITDLSKVGSLKVVERVKLQALLDEMKLSTTSSFDQVSAPRMGKLIRAEKLIKGSFLNVGEDKFRVDANFIGTQDGAYKQVNNVSGNLTDYFKLEKDLVFNIIDDMGIKLTDKEREDIRIIPTESFLAFVAYSKGLDMEDRGMYQEAANQYKVAVNIDPSFKQANVKYNEAQKVSNSSGDIETKRSEIVKPTTSGAMDRLIDGTANLTGEYVTGRDDHNPNTTSGFGRNTRIDFIFIIR